MKQERTMPIGVHVVDANFNGRLNVDANAEPESRKLHNSSLQALLIGERGTLIPRKADQNPQFDTIHPQDDKPTIFRPADIETGRVEFGFNGEKPDYILMISAAGIANGGPKTQTEGVIKGLKALADNAGIPMGFVGQRSNDLASENTSSPITSLEHIAEVNDEATTTPERYQAVRKGVHEAVSQLSQRGVSKLLVVSNGYTGFVSYGIKQAVREANESGHSMRAKVINQDSSYPDTDHPSEAIDPETGYPLDRFSPDAYRSDEYTDVYMILNNWLPINPKWSRGRAPDGTICGAASFPFTAEYIKNWTALREISQENARTEVGKIIGNEYNQMAEMLRQPDTIFIPLIASGGYWDAANIGKWLTTEQYEDMLQGSDTLVRAVAETHRRTGKPALLSGVKPFVDFVLDRQIEGVYPIEEYDASKIGVYVAKAPFFKPTDYRFYARAADLAIHRTSQANTMPEFMLAGTPAVVLTMPAHGYMNVEKMDREFYTRGGRQYYPDVNPQKLAERLTNIVKNPGEAASLVKMQDDLFLHVHMNRGTNFFNIIAHTAGVRIQ